MSFIRRLLILLLCALAALPVAPAEGAPAADRLPDRVLYGYYDNCLFVGDSLTVGLRLYVRSTQAKDPAFFDGARFYAVDSFLLQTAATERAGGSNPQLRYNGYDVSLAWLMGKLQPPRVFILAGMNDDIHDHLDRAGRYVDRIMALRDKYSPRTEICFFTLTPVTRAVGPTRRDRQDAYNAWLRQKCAAVGAVWVDIATPLKGPDGFLPDAFCRDGKVHLTREGYDAWSRALLDFAQTQYEAGAWAAVKIR